VYAYNFVTAASLSDSIARAAIRAEVGDNTGGRGVAIVSNAQDPFATAGIGVYAISDGLSSGSAALVADCTFGEGYGAVLSASNVRSALRLVPVSGVYPTNGQLGDLSAQNFATDANDGLAFHDGVAWRRVAHTAYRYREPAVGFENASSFTGAGTTAVLADATFTAADGGDVLICVDMGLSHTALTQVGITVASDDGSGGTVTTHLSSRDVRFATTTNASTETSRQWSWRRKVTPTNTGPRRYYVQIDVPGATTVYYWDVGLSVHGELTP
jgi:hypothetical protein